MKNKLKYIIAILMLLSLGIGFVPMVSLGGVTLTALDILKIGWGNYGSETLLREAAKIIAGYVKPAMTAIIILAVCIIAGAALLAVLKSKGAYLAGLVSQVIASILAVFMWLTIKGKMDQVSGLVDFFGLGETIRFHALPAVLWILLYLLILVLTIIGYRMSSVHVQTLTPGQILPENFRGQQPYRAQPQSQPRRVNPAQPQSQPRRVSPAQPQSRPRKTETVAGAPGFEGAVTGSTGIYAGKAYPLKERVPVYFGRQEEGICLSRKKGQHDLAMLFYVAAYGEYCMRPCEKLAVYLESGQPLGKDREYYLPRGTKIYLEKRDDAFTLA